MRILYIDNISPIGHIQYNRINLVALCKIGDVYTAMRRGYHKQIGVGEASILMEIPDRLYMPTHSKWRFFLYRIFRRITGYDSETQGTLKYVRDRVEDNWDAVIISHLESKSVSKMKPMSNLYAVCHQFNSLINNGIRLVKKDNRIKYTQDVGQRYTIIALSESMMDGIKKLNVKNVEMVPHGFLPFKGICDFAILDKFGIPRGRKILFIPSYSHKEELSNAFYNSKEFDTFLDKNNYFLVIKDIHSINNNRNVKVISSWVSDAEYKSLFLASSCILLPYDNTSPFRESGVVMECFANNKLCLRLNIPSLQVYDQYFNYRSSFSDISSLLERLIDLDSITQPYYKHLEKISNPYPFWCNLLNK